MKYFIILLFTISSLKANAQLSTSIIAVFDAPFDNSLQKIPSSEFQYIENFDRYTLSPKPDQFTCTNIDYNLGSEVAPWYELHISEIIDYTCEVIINAKENDPIILKSLNQQSQLSRLKNLSTFPIRTEVNNIYAKNHTELVHGLEIDRVTIEKEFPELIHHGANGEKGVYSMKFIPIIIKALQEQQELSHSYKGQLLEQRDLIDKLSSELRELKELIKK